MKALSPQMTAHLQSEVTTLCGCWKIVLTDKTEFGFTDHDRDIVYNGTTYKASTGFFRTAISNSSTMSPDELQVSGFLDDISITEIDLRAGRYDYAEVAIFLLNWQSLTDGPVRLRFGHFGEVVMTATGFYKIELRGLVQQLSQNIGRIIQPECDADLGDNRCKVQIKPPIRQALAAYKQGARVRIRNSALDKAVRLPINNSSFGSTVSGLLLNWDISNALAKENGAASGLYSIMTIDWVASISQTRAFQTVLGQATVTGTIKANLKRRATNTNQESRMYIAFLDATDVVLGSLSTDYTVSTGSYAQVTVEGPIPTGTTKVEYRAQTRQRVSTSNPIGAPFLTGDQSYFDDCQLLLTYDPGTGPTTIEMLLDGGFEIAVGSSTRTDGWWDSTDLSHRDGGMASLTSYYNMTAKEAGGYFFCYPGPGGLGTQNIERRFYSNSTLLAQGSITNADIDGATYVIDVNWLQANAGEYGIGGVGLCFFDSSNLPMSQATTFPELISIEPFYEWRTMTRTIPVPIGARKVSVTMGLNDKLNTKVITPNRACLDEIEAVLRPAGLTDWSYDQYAGVEYVANNDGVTANATPTNWPRSFGATVSDGGVTWTASLPLYTFLGTIQSVTSRSVFATAGISLVNQRAQWGTCEWLTGRNKGVIREIVDQTGNVITTIIPPPHKPLVGDVVVITVGCDKKITTCFSKFNNVANFRGFPSVPGTDQYFRVGAPGSNHASADEGHFANTGGVR